MDKLYFIDDYVHEVQHVDNPLLNLFNNWYRTIPYDQLSELLEESMESHPYETVILLFYLRDCHGTGIGDRTKFYNGVRWFLKNYPQIIFANLHLVPQFGYYRDLLKMWDLGNEELRMRILYLYTHQLKKDLQSDKPSLAAKWAPTEGSYFDKKYGIVRLFCEELNWSRRTYRLNIGILREKLVITERLASTNRWAEIDFPDISAESQRRLHKALFKKCGKRYQRYSNKISSINGEKLYDIMDGIRNGCPTASSKWNAELNKNQLYFTSALCVCDVGPSMNFSTTTKPINVAMALTAFISSRSLEFQNTVATYTRNPEIHRLSSDITNFVKQLTDMNWGYMIDICKLIQNLDKIPNQLFIFTDTNWYDPQFTEKYNNLVKDGYTVPEEIYYWNLNGEWGYDNFDMTHIKQGLIIIRGFTNELFNTFVNSGNLHPILLLRSELKKSRYSCINFV